MESHLTCQAVCVSGVKMDKYASTEHVLSSERIAIRYSVSSSQRQVFS